MRVECVALVGRRIQAIVPVHQDALESCSSVSELTWLVELHAALQTPRVRSKALQGHLKLLLVLVPFHELISEKYMTRI